MSDFASVMNFYLGEDPMKWMKRVDIEVRYFKEGGKGHPQRERCEPQFVRVTVISDVSELVPYSPMPTKWFGTERLMYCLMPKRRIHLKRDWDKFVKDTSEYLLVECAEEFPDFDKWRFTFATFYKNAIRQSAEMRLWKIRTARIHARLKPGEWDMNFDRYQFLYKKAQAGEATKEEAKECLALHDWLQSHTVPRR